MPRGHFLNADLIKKQVIKWVPDRVQDCFGEHKNYPAHEDCAQHNAHHDSA